MTSVRQMVIGPNIVIGGTYWWASRIYKRYGQNNGKKNNCKRIVFLTQENGIEKCAFFLRGPDRFATKANFARQRTQSPTYMVMVG